MSDKYKTYSFEEVVIDALCNPEYSFEMSDVLDGNEAAYYLLQIHYNKRNKYKIAPGLFKELQELLFNYDNIEIYSEYVESGARRYGADAGAYPPDGSWHPELHKIFGYYFWREPEGQEYGYFKSYRIAKAFERAHM